MKPQQLKIHKQDKDFVIYDCGPVHYVDVKAGKTLADHSHEDSETFWFVSGKGEMLVGDKIITLESPCKFHIPGGIYHKFLAKTDAQFLYKYDS